MGGPPVHSWPPHLCLDSFIQVLETIVHILRQYKQIGTLISVSVMEPVSTGSETGTFRSWDRFHRFPDRNCLSQTVCNIALV